MNKKTMKKIVTFVSMLTMVLMLGTTVFAANSSAPTPNDIKVDYSDTEGITELGGKLMGILSTIGIVVSVLVLMVLGIKYMMGSAEEKAEYKKTMIPYLVGAVLIFGASTIATVIFNFANGLNG